jgi:methionyl-tRNA formyltransferase
LSVDRIVFFGTPEFAVPSLQALCEEGYRPRLVVSQPARPAGRGQRIQDPPVAAWARMAGLDVMQPEKVNTRRFRELIEALEPDLGVVVAYGAILTPRLLEVPSLGFVNVHASLLPKYRGAAPIQAAIADGERVTGVTTMQVEPSLDAGPILLRREVSIHPRETTPELAARLAEAGAELLVDTIGRLDFGLVQPEPQDGFEATYAPKLTKADGDVDWKLPAQALFNRLRAYTPWPGLRGVVGGEEVKLLEFYPVDVPGDQAPGAVLGAEGAAAFVRCGEGTAVAVRLVQRPGRGRTSGAEFVRSLPPDQPEEAAGEEE